MECGEVESARFYLVLIKQGGRINRLASELAVDLVRGPVQLITAGMLAADPEEVGLSGGGIGNQIADADPQQSYGPPVGLGLGQQLQGGLEEQLAVAGGFTQGHGATDR